MENHHFEWVNQLFLWRCSIAMLNYQRVSQILGFHGMDFLSKLFEMRRVPDDTSPTVLNLLG